ncbi:MAG: UDP-N-acetylmuramoylalanine--D-glutamate ligase [Candidatus Komeilibacteria bacterium RIFCSPLOWO2_01_FULL_53_11]|uniref:UDP-N-acetylmuramoylalanine--D-glutamate ligase n=1 Tax=Candidatus Komeilibacteria bacterium RIFCSPLOWO2_01_FULL_53_11 TaxID=1798552 RepID=A0A1G2BTA9_9BACT|nr:MAG: UDP-N-acetylmuramoylalanine--D-glutamate ligase [Candidatus Komeilibacteria bacterium RIFCSPLOWO2_01_FULL_53_11]
MAKGDLQAEFGGKKIAILGFGVESQETVEFMLKHGAAITVFDEKAESAFDVSQLRHLREQGVAFNFGEFPSLTTFDIIVRSPGVKPGIQVLHEAGDIGITITTATSIFFREAPGITVGITGTKGKGTTSALLYQMLRTANKDAYIGGNIGVPALSFLHKLKNDSVSILELSSFQLSDAERSPHIAVALMVTQDHLDYHASTDEYVMAKMSITRHQIENDITIFNAEYPASVAIAERSHGKKYAVSIKEKKGMSCYIDGEAVMLAMDGKTTQVAKISEILLPGRHNLENVCAAVLAATMLKVDREAIIYTLKSFRGLEHRLELVGETNGIKYYNDSISTTPDSTIAAIRAFTSPEILILGGSSKGSDFTELVKVISDARNVKAIIGIGDEWQLIKKELSNDAITIVEDQKTMGAVVKKAAEIAKPGDIVILSPACASFDMFKDYKDRGNQFKRAVNSL